MNSLDSPGGHILITLMIFATGIVMYIKGIEYGKEISAGALGSLWTLLQTRRTGQQILNQGATIVQGVTDNTESH